MVIPPDLPRDDTGFRLRGLAATRTESFVDASIAFSITLLVISFGSIPASMDELFLALRRIPAFACSFALIAMFWWAHHAWSRRCGLEDTRSRLLSLLFVFVVLVYVFPLRIVSAVALWAFSGGFLPAEMTIKNAFELRMMFVVYGSGFTALCAVSALLYSHTLRRAKELELDARELHEARGERAGWWIRAASGLLSITVALVQKDQSVPGFVAAGLPGFMYMTIPVAMTIHGRRHRARAPSI